VNQLGAKWFSGGAPIDFTISLHIQSGNKTKCSIKGGEMEDLWLMLSWGSPIGTGIFLVCLGAMIYLISKADEKSKHTKVFAQEKGLEKKKEK
jgi:hypothetical protein